MVPFHKPIPNSKDRSGSSSGFGALVEAEKLMQIAFVMPSAVLIGWVGGWWLAHLTHLKWIEIAGVLLGCVTGLVYVIQTAIATEKKTTMGDEAQSGPGKGMRDPKS